MKKSYWLDQQFSLMEIACYFLYECGRYCLKVYFFAGYKKTKNREYKYQEEDISLLENKNLFFSPHYFISTKRKWGFIFFWISSHFIGEKCKIESDNQENSCNNIGNNFWNDKNKNPKNNKKTRSKNHKSNKNSIKKTDQYLKRRHRASKASKAKSQFHWSTALFWDRAF